MGFSIVLLDETHYFQSAFQYSQCSNEFLSTDFHQMNWCTIRETWWNSEGNLEQTSIPFLGSSNTCNHFMLQKQRDPQAGWATWLRKRLYLFFLYLNWCDGLASTHQRLTILLAPVVWRLDNVIQLITCYPLDKCQQIVLHYPQIGIYPVDSII